MSKHAQPPIKRKLTLAILSVCTKSVLILFGVRDSIGFEWYDFRRAMTRDMTILADVLPE